MILHDTPPVIICLIVKILHRLRSPGRWARKGSLVLAAALLSSSCAWLPPGRALYTVDYPVDAESPEFARALASLTGEPVVAGNRCRLLENGDQIFPAMLAAIRGAQHTINLEIYIFKSDATGIRFARALEERALAGVKVRVLVDGWGSHGLSKSLEDEMKKAGVEFYRFRPLLLFHKFKNRSHRKILVVDGRTAFLGGEGLDDRWDGDADSPGHWHDTAAEIEGPAVAQFQRIFSENWISRRRSIPAGPGDYPELTPQGNDDVLALQSSFGSRNSACAIALGLFIRGARKSLWIENAYFVPNPAVIAELCAAARRHVDVEIIVPGRHIDTFFILPVQRRLYGKLLEAGVRIFEYQPTMMHAKTLTEDSLWSTVGSINLDNRSFLMNDEANVTVRSPGFAAQLEEMFRRDRGRSREVTRSEWDSRSLGERINETFWGLFGAEF